MGGRRRAGTRDGKAGIGKEKEGERRKEVERETNFVLMSFLVLSVRCTLSSNKKYKPIENEKLKSVSSQIQFIVIIMSIFPESDICNCNFRNICPMCMLY